MKQSCSIFPKCCLYRKRHENGQTLCKVKSQSWILCRHATLLQRKNRGIQTESAKCHSRILDRKTNGDVMRCMKQMNQRSGISFLLVTHDAYTASFCDRVLFLQDGNLAKEVKKENTADNFREDIWKTLCGLGGGKDDFF